MLTSYQAKLLEIVEADTGFALDYTRALVGIRSPFDIVSVASEYTTKGIELVQRQTHELAGLAKTDAASST